MINKKIAITIGNPNGIGPEICVKALKHLSADEHKTIKVIGNKEAIDFYFKELLHLDFCIISSIGYQNQFRLNPGEKSAASGHLSYLFLEKSLQMAKQNQIEGIVTAPVSKELIVKSGYTDFIDHTTYLAKSFNINHYNMMFYSGDLKVVLATIHIPLKRVSKYLTQEKVESAIRNAVYFSQKTIGEDFRIAVCGLNPHAGENGLIGNEDTKIIQPVIEKYQKKHIQVFGPLPADSAFYKAYHKEFHIVIAMYHDQGLAPFKLLHFMDGVNLTLGLPIVRTSPDHGTAFDIAGKGIADETSMLNAIRLAQKLIE